MEAIAAKYKKWIKLFCISLLGFVNLHAQPGFLWEYPEPSTPGEIIEKGNGDYFFGMGMTYGTINQFGELMGSLQDFYFGEFFGAIRIEKYKDKYIALGSERAEVGIKNKNEEAKYIGGNWFNKEGDTGEATMDMYVDTFKKQIVMSGSYYTDYRGGNRHAVWVAGFDFEGNKLFSHYYWDSSNATFGYRILPNHGTGGYVILCYQRGVGKPYLLLVNDKGMFERRLNIEESGGFKSIEHFDFLLHNNKIAYYFNYEYSKNKGGIGLLLFNDSCTKIDSLIDWDYTSPIPNEYAGSYMVPLKGGRFVTYDNAYRGRESAYIHIHAPDGKIIAAKKIIERPENVINYFGGVYVVRAASDGGILAMAAEEYNDSNLEFKGRTRVMKLDSNGNLIIAKRNQAIDNAVMIQPNPATNQIYLRIPHEVGMVEAQYYDNFGRLVFTSKQMSNSPINISGLKPGMYFITATEKLNNQKVTIKLIKT